jgi:hypothetical protein
MKSLLIKSEVIEMEYLIREIITAAHSKGKCAGYELMQYVRQLLEIFAKTENAPSDWKNLGTELADEWNDGTLKWSDEWVYEFLELFNYGADECFGVAKFRVDDETNVCD